MWAGKSCGRHSLGRSSKSNPGDSVSNLKIHLVRILLQNFVMFTYVYVVGLIFILSGSLPDSNLLAIVTLCPNMQYRGILTPTTPAKTVPVWIPIRIWKVTIKTIYNYLKNNYVIFSAFKIYFSYLSNFQLWSSSNFNWHNLIFRSN